MALKAGILFYVYSMGFVIIWNTPNIYVEKCGEKSTIYFCTYTLCNRQWNGICKMLFLQKALFSYLFTLVAIYAAILRRTLTYTHLGKSHFEDVYWFIRCLLILINIYTKDIKRNVRWRRKRAQKQRLKLNQSKRASSQLPFNNMEAYLPSQILDSQLICNDKKIKTSQRPVFICIQRT